MRYDERPFFVDVEGDHMLAVASVPESPARIGLVIVVGGPQYRVGSHRQFVHLARTLAASGIACLRFDYRGMGDSDGAFRGFTDVAPDIRAALDAFFGAIPALERAVLWGLCDGATAAAFYAGQDPRVAGLVLFNPWVRTASGAARVALTHYYARRIISRGFWRKMLSSRIRWREALRELWQRLSEARAASVPSSSDLPPAQVPLPARLSRAIAGCAGPILVGLSGNDFVAGEYQQATSLNGELARATASPRVSTMEFPGVDHTFSRAAWRQELADATLAWLRHRFAGLLVQEVRPARDAMEEK